MSACILMCISKKATTLAMQLIRSLHLQSELCTNTDIDNFQQLVNSKAKKKKDNTSARN